MADQTLKQLRTAGDFISEARLKAGALAYLEADPDGTPLSIAANLGALLPRMYKIVPSVSSNNLTVAIQHLDGSAPSATNPLAFKIGDTWKLLSAAASFTKNAGTSWCNAGSAVLAGFGIDWFVYAINETGASAGVKFGFSRLPWARTMVDFVNTTTHEKYIAGNWTNFNGTDAVEVIGRFKAQLSAGAAFNWGIPSQGVINRPVYETDTLLCNVNPTGFSAVTINVTTYRMIGKTIFLQFRLGGTSNATTFGGTAPWTNRNTANHHSYNASGFINDGGTPVAAGYVEISPNSNSIGFKKSANAAWTGTATAKNWWGELFYEME